MAADTEVPSLRSRSVTIDKMENGRNEWSTGAFLGALLMTKNKGTPRRTKKIVRKPATKFAHLEKRTRKTANRQPPRTKNT